jgi:hypothetical protein
MQNKVVKVRVPKQLGLQQRKVILHVFIREILANITQVSDVASEPLFIGWINLLFGSITQCPRITVGVSN